MSGVAGPINPPVPILLCYDGSHGASRAVDGAGALFPGRSAIVLYVFPRVAVERVRTTSVAAVRDELIEEVRAAARRDAEAIAEEGASRARAGGLEARALAIEAADGVAESVDRVAMEEAAAAVVVGRPIRPQRGLRRGGVFRSVVDDTVLPVVVI